jgi:hypothetical protein
LARSERSAIVRLRVSKRPLGARKGLDRRTICVHRLLVAFMLYDRYRRLRALTLVEQVAELLVKALLAPPLPAHPPLVTHLDHLSGSGLKWMIALVGRVANRIASFLVSRLCPASRRRVRAWS